MWWRLWSPCKAVAQVKPLPSARPAPGSLIIVCTVGLQVAVRFAGLTAPTVLQAAPWPAGLDEQIIANACPPCSVCLFLMISSDRNVCNWMDLEPYV